MTIQEENRLRELEEEVAKLREELDEALTLIARIQGLVKDSC